jgi:hypothetical protein
LTEVKDMTSTIGDISAKSIIYQYKYIISNMLFYKFYKNYIDIIDSMTMISTDIVDGAMNTLVKTISVIND